MVLFRRMKIITNVVRNFSLSCCIRESASSKIISFNFYFIEIYFACFLAKSDSHRIEKAMNNETSTCSNSIYSKICFVDFASNCDLFLFRFWRMSEKSRRNKTRWRGNLLWMKFLIWKISLDWFRDRWSNTISLESISRWFWFYDK
jgi:hypothetical protein